MIYRRKTNFRYTFESPIPAYFRIIKIDGKLVNTSEGEAKIINISPEGIKLSSKLNIPKIDNRFIKIFVRFNLNQKGFEFKGDIIWKKKKGASCDYGIDMDVDEEERTELIKQLKIYSKNAVKSQY